jgi:hypothetical protein
VRRGLKAIVWTGVFAACAGAGAYVASHTNPFPPGVEDPGARPTETPSTSPAPTAQRWNLVMRSATRHELHVGGSCRSGWRSTGVLTIRPDGSASGEAVARLEGWGCDFAVAQVQTRIVRLAVSGHPRGGARLLLRFSEAGVGPPGSQDLGGFIATLPLVNARLQPMAGHGDTAVSVARGDGDLGRYVNDSKVQLDCATGC